MKIMTLNLWQYYDWAARKQNLLDLVHEQQPDVIALQEVQLNHAFSYSPASDYIANNCNYAYRVFAPTYAQNGQIDMQAKQRNEHHTAWRYCLNTRSCLLKLIFYSATQTLTKNVRYYFAP